MPGCWSNFFSCCKKTGVIFNEVVTVLEGLVNQTELFINVLIAAGAINANDDNVVQALRVLSKINGSLKVADSVAQRLKKFVPEDLTKVPDLNGDGRIDAKDLVMLLKDGQATLKDIINEGLVTSENALTWENVFIQLISALESPNSGLHKITGNRFAEAKTSLGEIQLQAVKDRLHNRSDNLLYVEQHYPNRAQLVVENNAFQAEIRELKTVNRELHSQLRARNRSLDGAVERALQKQTFHVVPATLQNEEPSTRQSGTNRM